jgi:hypothetical protein
MSAKYAANPFYVEHERQLLRLHELIAAGESESDAADAIRDEMDATWWKLSQDEQDRLAGLSGDLYALSGDEVFEIVRDPDMAARIAKQLEEAVGSNDWTTVLQLLRHRPINSSTSLVDAVRSMAYLELGHPRPALAFTEHGLRLDENNFHLRYQLMLVLTQLGCEYEAVQRGKHFDIRQSYDLHWLVHLVNLLPRIRRRIGNGYQGFLSLSIDKLRIAIQVAEADPSADQRLIAYGYASLALCNKEMGNLIDAVRSLNSALSLHVIDEETEQFFVTLREETIKAIEKSEVSVQFGRNFAAVPQNMASDKFLLQMSPKLHAVTEINTIYSVAA